MKPQPQTQIPSRKQAGRKPAGKIDYTPVALGLFMLLIWGMVLFLAGTLTAHLAPAVADIAYTVAWTGVGTSALAFTLLPATGMND